MLTRWLQAVRRDEGSHSNFNVIDVDEAERSDEQIRRYMAEQLIMARYDIEYLDDVGRELGWSHVEEMIEARSQPGATARRGQFGETLATSILREIWGCLTPVQMLRFTITGGQSQPGADALAFRLEDEHDPVEFSEVCWVETKLRIPEDRYAALLGAHQLRDDVIDAVPGILDFIGQRLREVGSPLYEPFLAYLRSRRDTREIETYHVFLVIDDQVSAETALGVLEEAGPVLDPLTVQVVSLAELKALTDEVFESIGIERVLDVD